MNVLYAAFGAEQIGLEIPRDGTAIMTYYMASLPSARGSITLASTDPTTHAVIDPNCCDTEADRFVMREGWRVLSRLMLETPEGQELVAGEITPEGHRCSSSMASDTEIDQRIKMGGVSCSHPDASCSMGKVVDAECRVKRGAGTEGCGCECDSGAVGGPLPGACVCVGGAGGGWDPCGEEVGRDWWWW